MKKRMKFVLIITALSVAACNNAQKTSVQNRKESLTISAKAQSIVLNDSTRRSLILRGSSIAHQMASSLQKHLKAAIKKGGLDNAIDYCHTKAMVLTDSVSRALNVKIKRAAKKNRNPFNETDEQESRLFKNYIIEWLSKKPLQAQIIPDQQGHPVYYAPIRINNTVCLKCHGTPGKDIPEERMAKIRKIYPNDKAVNFKYGELRGMWVITFPEYQIKKQY